jgi:hypothetical protein
MAAGKAGKRHYRKILTADTEKFWLLPNLAAFNLRVSPSHKEQL